MANWIKCDELLPEEMEEVAIQMFPGMDRHIAHLKFNTFHVLVSCGNAEFSASFRVDEVLQWKRID